MRIRFSVDVYSPDRPFHCFFFSTFDRDKCSGKSVNTTKKSALRLVKLHSLKVICWKLRKRISLLTVAKYYRRFYGRGWGRGDNNIKALRFLWCRPIFPNLSMSKVEKNRWLLFIFSVVSERLFSCSFNIKLETTGKTDVNCSETEISPVFVGHWHIGLLLLCFFPYGEIKIPTEAFHLVPLWVALVLLKSVH